MNHNNNFTLIREYNKIVGNCLFDYAGEIRTIPVQIGGTIWKPELPLIGDIIYSLSKIDDIKNIELKALKYFCYTSRTQIFINSNRRVAQLMANKVLIENNVGIFQIPIDKLEEFKTLLIEFYETNSDDEIISFMLNYCICKINT